MELRQRLSRHTSALKKTSQHNLSTLRRQPLAELSGSLGDLGTLLPLLLSMTLTRSISLAPTLIFTGLANIVTGAVFGIPLPVQPMKAIAATAISDYFSIRETMAAGLLVAGAVFLMSATGVIRWVGKVVPVPVVKGIQVGAGLSLCIAAGTNMVKSLQWAGPWWGDNLVWAVLAGLFLLICTISLPRAPYAMIVFIAGIILSLIHMHTIELPPPPKTAWRPWHPRLYVPHGSTWAHQALGAALAQLPLTTLNSIIAVSHLSADLLPSLPHPSETSLGISVAVMNLVGCWFGAMPACHGSGGLAGQYRFGARSGASVIVLGLVKFFLGLFVGDGLLELLRSFPQALLGVMVIAAGVELARVGESLNGSSARDLWEEAEEASTTEDANTTGSNETLPVNGSLGIGRKMREVSEKEKRERWIVMIITVAGLLAFKNDAVGFVAGMCWHWGLRAPDAWARWRESRGENRGRSWVNWGRGWFGQWRENEEQDAQTGLLENHDAPEGRLV
ncbi:hypothetical protein K402DRAFT_371763 [Aulographum hederae CBS 113979]|uniref:Sulfate transporter n=1 Tax=Aulographum hederae CBS 113979 TaxID=1176131 RepID=A0A6G1H9A0_9PEZI|nr:hypothetical protein K402DRAFT_371763 [Aulographum hederae CBS 113979]